MNDALMIAEVAKEVRLAARIAPERLITADSRLIEDLGIDSLDLVGVYLRIQDRFGIDINEEDVPGLRKISDLANYVSGRQESAAA